MNHPIDQRGKNLSGGQKQRLSIARTLIKKPNILILDDATSALDFTTQKEFQQALNKYNQQTKIIITQRISNIKNADQILILDQGKIAGLGTHQQLLNTNDIYQTIAYSQLGQEVSS